MTNAVDVIFTPNAEHLESGVKGCKKYFFSLNKDGTWHFPDGEIYGRLEKIGEIEGPVLLVSSAQGVLNQSEEVFLVYSTLKNLNDLGKEIKKNIFFSLYPFSRQDQHFTDNGEPRKGEFVLAKDVAETLVKKYGVEEIYAIDAHFYKKNHPEPWFLDLPITNLSMVPKMMDYVKERYGDVIFKSPDKGGEKRTGIKGSKKNRIDSYTVETELDETDVRGKIVCIIDDLSATGGTQIRKIDEYLKKGAKRVVPEVTHVTMDKAIPKIEEKAGVFVYSNSVNVPGSKLDVSPLIQEIINKM